MSTTEVARKAGVHPMLLERWLVTGKVAWPRLLIERGRIVRLWEAADVERIRTYKAEIKAKSKRA